MTWHLTQLFYDWHPDDLDDHVGNHILVQLVRPLFRELKYDRLVKNASFNRFAQGGNHIQMLLQIEPSQKAHLESILKAKLDAYLTEHTNLFPKNEIHLNSLSQLVQRDSHLHHAGDYEMQLFQPSHDKLTQDLFENELIQASDDQWQDFLAQMWLSLLAQDISPQARMHVLRLWLVYYFRLNAVSSQDQAVVLSFLIRQWTTYFGIEGEFSRHIAQYHQQPQPYITYFEQIHQHPDDIACVLPAPFRSFFRHAQQVANHFVTEHPLLLRRADGRLTDYSLLRCFGTFHINHNRLAIPIFKELFWAYAMLQQLLPTLSTSEQAQVESDVTRMSQYFQQSQGVQST